MQDWVSCNETKAIGEGLLVLQVNQKVSKTAHIKELNQEIDRLKAELFCTREKNGVYMPAELFQQREQVACAAEPSHVSPTVCRSHSDIEEQTEALTSQQTT